jgi:uncharacterized protein
MSDPEKEEQIKRLAESNEEFRRLYEEHRRLGIRIEDLCKRRNLSDAQHEELRMLKKEKLLTKDALGRMLFEDEM